MKYFSEQRRSGGVTVYTGHELTESSTFRFLRHDREGCQHLNYNVNGHVRHCRSRRDAGVYLKPVEETFDAVEDVDKLVSAGARILNRLGALGVKIGLTTERCKKPTESRTLIPAKTTLTGGNA